MIDTKAKRAAALGYGLSFLLVLPPADGAISIPDAGHALSAYQFDMPAAVDLPIITIVSGVRSAELAYASGVLVSAVIDGSYAADVFVGPAAGVDGVKVD